MKKHFVPYEIALKLKELGFDELVTSYFLKEELNFSQHPFRANSKSLPHHNELLVICAPLYSQAYEFFRNKYNLEGYVVPIEYLDGTPKTYQWNIYDNCHSGADHLSHEEANLECLRRLIELAKQNKK